MLLKAGLDVAHALMREPVAVLADDLPCGLVGKPGSLGVAVTVGYGIEENINWGQIPINLWFLWL